MKKLFRFTFVFYFAFFLNVSLSQFVLQYKFLDANNINSIFWNSGVFNQDPRTQNTPGFEWPKGSGKHACFTAGISLSARVNGLIRQAIASYHGECYHGYCNDSVPVTNSSFRFYKVSAGDNSYSNPDWNTWAFMVHYGAPYIDANHNGVYEPVIDTPGVRGAASTIFICLTDGFASSHTAGEGFGGGTLPLFAEIHLTAWAYSQSQYADMQFMKYEIINKSKKPWTNTYLSIISDVDLGDGNDDYIACDTIRRLGICYNADNNDEFYGLNPPAFGIMYLKGMVNKSVLPNVNLGMTGFSQVTHHGYPCTDDPNGQPLGAYLYMKGLKKDSSSWLDPTQNFNVNHYKRTKFCYYGDPETNAGWTPMKGFIDNCDMGLNDIGTMYAPCVPNDQRLVMSSGAENFTMNVRDTQTVFFCQLIARGTSNLNSVTKLKQLSDVAQNLFNNGFTIGIHPISSIVPDKYSLSQNYPNPFNPNTIIRFQIKDSRHGGSSTNNSFVTLKVYDILGKEISTLVNEKLQAGEYEVQFPNVQAANVQLHSGVYFYKLTAGDFSQTKKMLMIK